MRGLAGARCATRRAGVEAPSSLGADCVRMEIGPQSRGRDPPPPSGSVCRAPHRDACGTVACLLTWEWRHGILGTGGRRWRGATRSAWPPPDRGTGIALRRAGIPRAKPPLRLLDTPARDCRRQRLAAQRTGCRFVPPRVSSSAPPTRCSTWTRTGRLFILADTAAVRPLHRCRIHKGTCHGYSLSWQAAMSSAVASKASDARTWPRAPLPATRLPACLAAHAAKVVGSAGARRRHEVSRDTRAAHLRLRP
mmetsp:Transcript_27431/g.80685  ORF Transcript_27431/g.80685 Transcript_27431/m.80685 type:complete len:251 (-) Transcript_27431:363-1115(-)